MRYLIYRVHGLFSIYDTQTKQVHPEYYKNYDDVISAVRSLEHKNP